MELSLNNILAGIDVIAAFILLLIMQASTRCADFLSIAGIKSMIRRVCYLAIIVTFSIRAYTLHMREGEIAIEHFVTATLLAAFIVLLSSLRVLIPDTKLSASAVNYRENARPWPGCGDCHYFEEGSCRLINVNPTETATCDMHIQASAVPRKRSPKPPFDFT